MKLFLLLTSLLSLFCLSDASAGVQFTPIGAADINSSGYSFASSPSFLLGAQLTMDVGYPFQVGIAYEHNGLSYDDGSSGDLKFYGVVARMRTVSPFFVDFQAGVDVRDSNGVSFSWGVGGGYAIPLLSSIDFAPRIGYRFVPDSGVERSLIDFGAIMSFKFN